MDIEATRKKLAVVSNEDMEGVRVYSQAGLETMSTQGLFEKGKVPRAIAQICSRVWLYLQEQFEDPWTGTICVVVVSNPESGTFEMETYYDVVLFPDYTRRDLGDMFDGALAILEALEDFRDLHFSFDFRVKKNLAHN